MQETKKKKDKKGTKIPDLKPVKDAKGGGGKPPILGPPPT